MRTIWKYSMTRFLSGFASQKFEIPKSYKFLSFQLQGETPTFWLEVESKEERIEKTFAIIGTGHLVPFYYKKYLGTCQTPPFVWHLYELEND